MSLLWGLDAAGLRAFVAHLPDEGMQERMQAAALISGACSRRETTMKMKSISLAAALVLASTAALAQGNAAGPAGAVDKKGDATSPGGTVKE
jgi:hypothetical protein